MNVNQQKSSPTGADKEEEKETLSDKPKQGSNPPDAEDASAEDMQESDFGDKSYASPVDDSED